MAEPLLTELFGPGATQTADTLTISKTDLATVGLTPAADNRAESLLAAVIRYAETKLTEANQNTNPDQSIMIEPGFSSFVTRGETTYRRNQRVVNFDKIDTQAGITPDDY